MPLIDDLRASLVLLSAGVPDFKRCGGGKGAECCTFLTIGAQGFCCERGGALHDTLVDRTKRPGWSSKRIPTEPYPQCQLPEEA